MKNTLHQLKSFVTFWLDAVDAHSLHSPFLFDLYVNTLKARKPNLELKRVEQLRQELLFDNRSVGVTDLGSGASSGEGSTRKISAIARISLSPKKYSLLYRRIIQRYDCRNIIELGTSLGINTLYLAAGENSRVLTFEGSSAIAAMAKVLFDKAQSTNIELVPGNIDESLPKNLQSIDRVDFALIDANHRYDPTVNYFNLLVQKVNDHSIVVLDDIHYSSEMEKAWVAIQKHPKVSLTVDAFRCGIVFFNPSLGKQHVVLQL